MNTSFLDFKRASQAHTFHDDFSHYVKSFGDVYFWEQGGFHVVTNAEAAKVVLTSPDFSADRGAFFISRMPDLDLKLLPDFFRVVGKMMVMSDGKNHTRRRQVATHGMPLDASDGFYVDDWSHDAVITCGEGGTRLAFTHGVDLLRGSTLHVRCTAASSACDGDMGRDGDGGS